MIFLGGIHGVGKTSLLKEIKTAYNVSIYSASGLISQLKDDEYVKNKYRASIIEDQNILLRALNEFVKETEYILKCTPKFGQNFGGAFLWQRKDKHKKSITQNSRYVLYWICANMD